MKRSIPTQLLKTADNERGFVLITVLTLTFLLFGLAMCYADILLSERRLVQGSINSLNAQGLGEAGIDQAMWEYNYNSAAFTGWSTSGTVKSKTVSGFTDSSGHTFGNYTVSVDTSTAIITSTSTLTNAYGGSLSATLKAKVASSGLFTNGIKASGTISFDSNADTDSYIGTSAYNSSTNVYQNGDVVTTSTSSNTITLDSNSHIYGDAATGTGGTVSPSNQVTGTISSGYSESMPTVTVPSSLTALPSSGALTDNATISADTKYTNINLDSNKVLTINGNVKIYVTNTSGWAIALGSGGSFKVNAGGSLTVYSAGNINIDSNALLYETSNSINKNSTQGLTTTSVSLYGTSTCTVVDIGSNALINGTVCVPSADVQLDSNVDIYGAIIGKSFDIGSNADVHYDETLANSGASNGYELSWYRRVS